MTDSASYDSRAEEALLGSVLINPPTFYETRGIIGDPKIFHIVRNRWVWETYMALAAAGREIDYITVCDELERAGHLKEIGGPARITELINTVPTAVNGVDYAHVISNWAECRRIEGECVKIVTQCRRGAARAELYQGLQRAVSEGRTSGAVVPISDTCRRLSDKIDRMQDTPGGVTGVRTGIADVDDSIKCLECPGETILFGLQGDGKTTLADQTGLYTARHSGPVLMVSMEMSDEATLLRLACADAGIDSANVKTYHGLTTEQRVEIDKAIARIHDLPIHITTGSGYSTAEIQAEMARYQPILTIVDHMRYLTDKRQRTETEADYLDRLYRELRKGAFAVNGHVIAIAHSNKTSENRGDHRPTMADLQQASGNAADYIWAVYRPMLHEKDPGDVIGWANWVQLFRFKDRNLGRTGPLDLFFDAQHTRFCSVQKKEHRTNEYAPVYEEVGA